MKRPQDGAIITQFDYPTLRGPRPDQDGLPRPAQPHLLDDALEQHRAQPRRAASSSRSSPLDDPPTYELLARGDTLGVFQLDGGADAGAAALDAARPLRGHLRRPARSTAPDRWAPTPTTTTPSARTAASRSTRSTPSSRSRSSRDPRRDLRPDRLPGAGHGRSPRSSPATPWARPTCCAARWARRRRRSSTSEYAGFSDGHAGQRLLRGARSRRSGTSCVPFSDYAFNKAHTAGLRPDLLLDRLPQGELPGRVHGRAADRR